MSKLSTTKIEKRALNALESIIDRHDTMDHDFYHDDKEMSWDGFIWLNKKGNGIISKSNTEARIPVQIKGHETRSYNNCDKNSINLPVSLEDLNLYATEKGVLYFQIFLSKTTDAEIYYSSLYPSKIADYIDLAVKRGNKKSISISFTKLEQDPKALFIVVKQFNEEAKKQGSVFTPTVQDRICSDEFKNLKVVNFSVFGKNDDMSKILKRLSIGDICLYGKTDINEKYFRPLKRNDKTTFYSGAYVEQEISVNGEVFYKKYQCIIDSNERIDVIPSPNLKMRMSEGKFDFTPKTNLKEMVNDVKFLLAIHKSDTYCIGSQEFKIEIPSISDKFVTNLKFVLDAYDATCAVGLEEHIYVTKLSNSELKSLVTLVNLNLGTYKDKFVDVYTRYDWKLGDKYYPLLVNKIEGRISIDSSIYAKKHTLFLSDQESEELKYRMPSFAYHKPEVLANLYLCDYDQFKKQIQLASCNHKTAEELNKCSLSLIGAYDISGDKEFLKLAQLLLDRIIEVNDNVVTLMNRMQIKTRLEPLDKDDIQYLNSIKSNELDIMFGKSVLLGDYKNAKHYYCLMKKEDQKRYNEYPIYTLYKEMEKE